MFLLKKMWFPYNKKSGKRDSDPRPQPWQGCALPTELFPQKNSNSHVAIDTTPSK